MKWRALASSLRFALLLAALSSAPTLLSAQVQATTGIIRGTTMDASGNPVAATVTIRNTETNFTRTIRTSDVGIFVATLVPLGNYQVSARAVGHNPAQRSDIVVNLGQAIEVPLVMERVATTLAGVTVLGQNLIDQTKTAEATQLPAEVVSGLPNNGRNYLNLTTLTPNVAITQGPDGDVIKIGRAHV